jgi:hypothetical protein
MRLFVVVPQAALPDRCVKCNAPAEGFRKRMRLAWHSPLAYLGLLFGLLPYIVIALMLTRRLTVEVGVCQAHMKRRRLAIAVGWLGSLLGFVVLFVGAANDSGPIILIGIVLLLGSIVYGILASRIVWPTKIENKVAWVKGACPEYLAALPEMGP